MRIMDDIPQDDADEALDHAIREAVDEMFAEALLGCLFSFRAIIGAKPQLNLLRHSKMSAVVE
jgi:hypothetical protein